MRSINFLIGIEWRCSVAFVPSTTTESKLTSAQDAFMQGFLVFSSSGYLQVLTVAEMRDKAGKAKNATVTSLQNTKDRHSRLVSFSSI
jgi:hypothetical protein